MTVGVDSSLIVAALHANHPRHALAADWLIRNLGRHRLVVGWSCRSTRFSGHALS